MNNVTSSYKQNVCEIWGFMKMVQKISKKMVSHSSSLYKLRRGLAPLTLTLKAIKVFQGIEVLPKRKTNQAWLMQGTSRFFPRGR